MPASHPPFLTAAHCFIAPAIVVGSLVAAGVLVSSEMQPVEREPAPSQSAIASAPIQSVVAPAPSSEIKLLAVPAAHSADAAIPDTCMTDVEYARFEDVPECAYQANLRNHYGDVRSAIFTHEVTIGGIPCAAGEIELHHNIAEDRCAEGSVEREELCRRNSLREYERWKRREGVSDGYVIESCVLAKDARIGSVRVPAGTLIYMRPNGVLESTDQ